VCAAAGAIEEGLDGVVDGDEDIGDLDDDDGEDELERNAPAEGPPGDGGLDGVAPGAESAQEEGDGEEDEETQEALEALGESAGNGGEGLGGEKLKCVQRCSSSSRFDGAVAPGKRFAEL
jgi:hypothetical protein